MFCKLSGTSLLLTVLSNSPAELTLSLLFRYDNFFSNLNFNHEHPTAGVSWNSLALHINIDKI